MHICEVLEKLTKKYCLRFQRKEKFKVLFGLLRNVLLYTKWRLYKLLHGINHTVIHYYAVCWNEEKMLPFMFQHYDSKVSQYFIYDNGSTDASHQIITNHPKTELIPFVTDGFNDEIQNAIKNECWKSSIGKADYVIVCDIDEFLYSPDIDDLLSQLKKSNISIPQSQGFDMCSIDFTEFQKSLTLVDQLKTGVYNNDYSKCILFNPYKIVDINYEPGAHFCRPTGLISTSEQPLYNVLHYKNLGLDYVLERARQYRLRMSDENISKGYALQYLGEENTIKKRVSDQLQKANIVIN